VGMPLSGLLCLWWGWESVFYFFGKNSSLFSTVTLHIFDCTNFLLYVNIIDELSNSEHDIEICFLFVFLPLQQNIKGPLF